MTPERKRGLSLREREAISEVSARINGSVAIAHSLTGAPLFELTRQIIDGNYPGNGQEIFRAAAQSYALDTRDKGLYDLVGRLPDLEAPRFDGEFVVLDLLFKRNTAHEEALVLNREEITRKIEELLGYAQIRAPRSEVIYSPFFIDTLDIESQLMITGRIRRLYARLETDLEHLKRGDRVLELKVEDQPVAGMVINPITRGKCIPTSFAGNKNPKDIETGNSDAFFNTSFRRGDRVVVLANYRGYSFVGTRGSYGWVRTGDVALIGREDNEVFYVGEGPLFLEQSQAVLLPGDSVFVDLETSKYFLPDPEVLTEGFSTPQQFLNFLYNAQLPYIFGVFDCSELIRRAFKILGYDIPKYSADINAELSKLGTQTIVSTPEELALVQDGLYIAFRLGHMYVVTVRSGKFEAFSQTFNIKGDSGEVEYPVGPHVCHKQALVEELERLQGKRVLTFSKIAVANGR